MKCYTLPLHFRKYNKGNEFVMENFIFENNTKVIFGKSSELQVDNEVKRYSNKILLHYGGGSI